MSSSLELQEPAEFPETYDVVEEPGKLLVDMKDRISIVFVKAKAALGIVLGVG